MIRDITLGQYYPGDSILHRLDPRIKILATLAYIILLFIVNEWIGFAACFLFLAAAVSLSRVPLSFILRGLKVIFIIILFTFVLNLFMTIAVWSHYIHLTLEDACHLCVGELKSMSGHTWTGYVAINILIFVIAFLTDAIISWLLYRYAKHRSSEEASLSPS